MARQVGYRSNSNWEEMLKWWISDGSHSRVDVEYSEEEEEEMNESHSLRHPLDVESSDSSSSSEEEMNESDSRRSELDSSEKETKESSKKNQRQDRRQDVFPYDDEVDRVYQIATILKEVRGRSFKKKGYTSAHIKEWLCELLKYVESVDIAYEIHSKGGLVALLKLLYYKEAGIRAKAAQVITAMLHNNPSTQHLIIKTKGCLKPLFYNFFWDTDPTARTNTLVAISALIRNNDPGITAFRRASGYEALRDALRDDELSSESVRFQREALNLIQYLLHENSSDCNIVTELEFPCIMMHLASSSDDAEVRQAALRCLLVLARDEEGGNSGQLVKNDDKLKQALQERIEGISAMASRSEDIGAAREEIQLLDSLWNACYNEHSSLRGKGLLELPGEDAPAPDVASNLFEPPLAAEDAPNKRRKLH